MKQLQSQKITLIILLATALQSCAHLSLPDNDYGLQNAVYQNIVFNAFMLKSNGEPANWLGLKLQDRHILEPVNLLILDSKSATADESVSLLEEACRLAGYPKEIGHSTGYTAFINGSTVLQLPKEAGSAFSDNHFLTENNHGRIFGPVFDGTRYIYTAQFSRESVALFSTVFHAYESFNTARNHFAQSMDSKTDYKLTTTFQALNAVDSPLFTTGDHDGYIFVLDRH